MAGKPNLDVPRGTAANILRQAYCPDLPGVGVVGDTQEEVERLIRDAITFHLDGLREAGEPVPAPSAVGTTLVEVPAA